MKQRRRKARKRSRPLRDISLQQALVKALSHPARAKALVVCAERNASPSEIAKELKIATPTAAYHVKVLEELGLVELVEEAPVRGSVAHFYKAVRRDLSDDPDSVHASETLLSDVVLSISAGTFDRREDRHLSRTPLVLDERGWRQVTRIQASALKRILKEQAAAAGRMNGSRETAIRAILGVWLFELPWDPSADE
jgi:predicted ArsR family transcriptional regulator